MLSTRLRPIDWRLAVAHSSVWAICAAVIVICVGLSACSRPVRFEGTRLKPANPAPSFTLQNQFGQRISLSDYDGKVLVLTFLYTNCPDVCPIVASQLRQVYDLLGDDAHRVAFASISVDPARDSVETAYAFSERWDMTGKWDFLVGDEDLLSKIWKAYYLDPTVVNGSHDDGGGPVDGRQADAVARGAFGTLQENIAGSYGVLHSTPVYLIDQEGRMRVVFTPPLEPQALATDIRLLLE